MRVRSSRRVGLIVALCLGLLPWVVARARDEAPAKPKPVQLRGKVVPLASIVEKHGAKLDPEAAPQWMALVADDGKVYPLIKDDVTRMFFKDERLLNRPMQLTGRVLPGGNLLHVLEVHSLLKGEPHEVYYWCDVCTIKRFEKKACDCCGGPMELREVPVKK